jgi:hypothetical protein
LRIHPNYAEPYSIRAAAHMGKGDAARARSDCDAALRLAPKCAPGP